MSRKRNLFGLSAALALGVAACGGGPTTSGDPLSEAEAAVREAFNELLVEATKERLNERFGDTKRRAKIHQQIHAHVKLWRQPFEACIPHAREAARAGIEAGDFAYAGYGAATESWPALLASRDLGRFVRDQTPALAFLAKINMSGFRDALRIVLNWALDGHGILVRSEWDPVQNRYGGLVMIYGTLMSSLIALLIAVPVSFGIALFLFEGEKLVCERVYFDSGTIVRQLAGDRTQGRP